MDSSTRLGSPIWELGTPRSSVRGSMLTAPTATAQTTKTAHPLGGSTVTVVRTSFFIPTAARLSMSPTNLNPSSRPQESLAGLSPGSEPSSTSPPPSSPTAPPSSISPESTSNLSNSGSHRSPHKVIVALSTALGLVLLAVIVAISMRHLRRLYHDRRLSYLAQRAQASVLCTPTPEIRSARDAAVLQRDSSPSHNTQISIATPSSLPSYSMIHVAIPRASVSVASPASPLDPLEEHQRLASLPITPQTLGEDMGGAKTAEAIPSVAVPVSEQDLPASHPADLSATSIRNSAVLRWTRSVMTLSDVADEEEREMPPPYQPGSPRRAMHNAILGEESGTY